MPVNWDEVAEYVQGTSHSDAAIAAAFEMTQAEEDEIGSKMLDYNMERCDAGCGWWFESHEFHEQTNGEFVCTDCSDDPVDED